MLYLGIYLHFHVHSTAATNVSGGSEYCLPLLGALMFTNMWEYELAEGLTVA